MYVTNAAELLAQQIGSMPWLVNLNWDLQRHTAVADLDALSGLGQRFDRETKKVILTVRPAPETLPVLSLLHAGGWKLGDEPANGPMWRLNATLADEEVSLTVKGYQSALPDGTDFLEAAAHAAGSYWSPPPPEMRGRGWKARVKEWNNRYVTGDWDGWTHTPRPQLPPAPEIGAW